MFYTINCKFYCEYALYKSLLLLAYLRVSTGVELQYRVRVALQENMFWLCGASVFTSSSIMALTNCLGSLSVLGL